ncbi:Deoxyribose-phosphate aldolase [Phytophthora palmivora]|uniref:Deoxyribose-phosphate aldolase n=1 Tax=Phytophthora palmivora TaxID=4796 RepID=A0A2P4YTD1_9STRA|nr:Deoxyribose-phosphate aldolase [Phytophthora palmivora]
MASPARKRAKRIVPFLEAHEGLYGVRVVERDPVSHEATSVLCMFCAAFGREDDPRASSRQRARTQKPKYWNGPTFRTDNYKSHLTMQHPVRWNQYQEMMPEQRQRYFDAVPALPKSQKTLARQNSAVLQPPIATSSEQDKETSVSAPVSPAPEVVATDSVESDESIPVPMKEVASPVVATSSIEAESEAVLDGGDRGEVLTFLLDRDVVDVALGDVLFRAEDVDNGGKTMVMFESTLDPRDTEDEQRSDGTAEVRAVVRSVALFHRVVDLLAVGLSFDQTAAICQAQATAGIRDNTFVVAMARVVVGGNLQALARAMWVWKDLYLRINVLLFEIRVICQK